MMNFEGGKTPTCRLCVWLLLSLLPLLCLAFPLKGTDSARTALYIAPIHGKAIYDINSELPLIPASITKCVTSASVLSLVDVDDRFVTPVAMRGKIDKQGVLHGDIVIKATGDPSLESRFFPEYNGFADSLAIAAQNKGIKTIEGGIIIDFGDVNDQSVPFGWEAGDLSHAYGTGWHALNYRDNSQGKKANHAPWDTMAKEVSAALIQLGITVSGGKTSNVNAETTLMEWLSPTYYDILSSLMTRSDNMMAEGMLRILAPKGARVDAISEETQLWQPANGVRLYDGSGLSREDRLTAHFLGNILVEMAQEDYISLFPRAGQEGTVRHLLGDTPLASRVVLKSGSMHDIQSWAGYVLDTKGAPTHVVVMMANGLRSRQALKSSFSQLLLDLFAQ